MKILFITTGYPRFRGDTFGCFIEDVALELSLRDQITVLAPHAPGYPWREQHGNLKILRLPYFFWFGKVAYGGGIPTNLKSWSCRLQLPFFVVMMTLYVLVLARKYDLLHAEWGVNAWFAWPASLLWRKKLVVSYHGSDLHGPQVIQKISRAIAHRSHANICISEQQADQLGAPAQVISCGIDANRFSPVDEKERQERATSLGLPSNLFLWLYVGSLIPLKRVHLLIEALGLCPQDAHLVIVGEGPCLDDLKQLSQSKDLARRVHFLGSLPYHQVHEAFQACHLHGLVSEREGKPNVVYQAMSCGIPSMATSVGGIPEQIEDGRTGWLVEGNAQALADRVCVVVAGFGKAKEQQNIQNQELSELKKMGLLARERLMGLGIDISTIASKHREVYNSVL